MNELQIRILKRLAQKRQEIVDILEIEKEDDNIITTEALSTYNYLFEDIKLLTDIYTILPPAQN